MELNVLPLYGEAFLRLLYPSCCALCDCLLELTEKGICLVCGEELKKARLAPSEERIRVSLSFGDEAWALYRYEGAFKEILRQIKFLRRRDLLRVFDAEIEIFLKRRPGLLNYDWLIPIPLDRRRRGARQFNQSALLASKIFRILSRGKDLRLAWGERFLLKKRPTLPQSLLGREARRLNLERIFKVRRPRLIEGRSVLLVDDVFTTGATLEEAAKTLKGAGAGRVGYLTLARALPN